MRRARFLSSPDLWARGHGRGHPLRPERLQRTFELLEELGTFEAPNVQLVPPRPATEEQLRLFHTGDYVCAVRALSRGEQGIPAARYGFGPGDNPVFTGMYESEALKVGSSLLGAQAVAAGDCNVAFSYGGGLHHAGPDFASGFCVFNDAAVAIEWLRRQGLRVAYVDVDVHHGDGVQDAFYDTGQVLTISLHQSGRTLFPGRGFVEETGRGQGEGACANIPLPPSTDDQAYLAAFDAIVPALVERFEPDVLVTQLGVDTHYLDPLANLALTTRGHRKLFEAFHGFGLPWLALGGGGYNLDVVPRAWTLAFAVMAGLDWPEELPPGYRAAHGGRWLEDREEPQMGDRVAELTRRRVEQIIRQVKELHGLA